MQFVPAVAALRDVFSERIDDEVFELMIPQCNWRNGLELIAEVLCIGDPAIYGDNDMMRLDEYRIVVTFSVQNFLTRRILQGVMVFGIVFAFRRSFINFGAEQVRFTSDFYAEGNIAFFLTGIHVDGIGCARQAVLRYPETDSKNAAERLPAFVLDDAHAGGCFAESLVNLHRLDGRFAWGHSERVCSDIDAWDDGQVLRVARVVFELVECKRVAVVAKKDGIRDARLESDGDNHGIEFCLVDPVVCGAQGVLRDDDRNANFRNFELFARSEIPQDVLRDGVRVFVRSLDERNLREFHGRNFVEDDGSGFDILVLYGDAVERARDAERVAQVELVGAELEFEACVFFELYFGDGLRLQVGGAFFDGNGLVAGLRVVRVANLQGIVACGDAIHRVLAVVVCRGGLDGGHAGCNVRCRDEVYLGACDRVSAFVLDGTFDACDGRAGFSFREHAGVVLVGAGGENRCEGKNPCCI